VIAARLLPAPLEARLPADPARLSGVRRAVAAWTATAGVPEEVAEDLQLALGEALANAVEHAYAAGGDGAGRCSYRVARDADGGIRVEVRDTGVWRPPPADKGFRGRGLDLIHALGSDVEISHRPGATGTSVRFRMPPGGDGTGVVPRQRAHPTEDGGGAARLLVHDGPEELRLAVLGELRAGARPVAALRRPAAARIGGRPRPGSHHLSGQRGGGHGAGGPRPCG
jgi:anti-sigma regulatory factor (Ser/Thr protein kinase)